MDSHRATLGVGFLAVGNFGGSMATTTVEFDRDLLARLRERSPGKSDRELLEELAAVTLGSRRFIACSGAPPRLASNQEEIEGEAVRVVREHRRRRAAGQAAT